MTDRAKVQKRVAELLKLERKLLWDDELTGAYLEVRKVLAAKRGELEAFVGKCDRCGAPSVLGWGGKQTEACEKHCLVELGAFVWSGQGWIAEADAVRLPREICECATRIGITCPPRKCPNERAGRIRYVHKVRAASINTICGVKGE